MSDVDAVIKCKNPACPGPSNVLATYVRVWIAPALGDTADSAPHPQPCPNDAVQCAAVLVRCNTCGWTKNYPV